MTGRRVAEVGAAMALVCALAGCSGSGEGKDYATPKSLCGVSIDPDLIEPFLPAGKGIAVQKKTPVPSRTRCQVNVDGKVAFVASQEWWERGDTITDVAASHTRIDADKSADGEKYLYSGTGGFGRAGSCTNTEHPEHALFTVAQVFADGHEDAPAMRRLITAYTKSVERSSVCR
ncbi:hypothetical protein [Streptomyces sp. NPDC057696]|uniref:hypothetical protein n=1 Tax=Streptomyces sp. NPDC057696 TaxID=3346218 RepID=UPI0036B5B050